MTESFEDAMVYAQAIMADCDVPILDHLQKAHDHEMEQLRRARFREGYEAGQRSMDAAHYLLKLRLQGLKFGDGSHENLSRLAYAIYPCPTGWGKESCEGLRDKLIELLGGVHDEPAPIPASRCACDAGCDCGCEQPQTVAMYDELDNERHKAVCRLREFVPMIGNKPTEEASKLIRCITGKSDSHVACGNDLEETRDRLIHLLGGDECNFSGVESYMDDMGEKSNPAKTSSASTDHVILDTPLPEDETSPNDNGTCPNDDPTSSITDELRKFKGHINAGLTPGMVLALRAEINCIADRIDEQEPKLKRQRDEFKRGMVAAQDLLRKRTEERDELRKSLREIAERAGLPQDSNLDEYPDDLVAKATLAAINDAHEYIGALEWQRDRQRKLLDEYDKTHMKLPVDANGESVHVGDIMEYAEDGKPKEVIAVSDTEAFLVDDGPRYSSLCVHHVPVDTAESIVRDIHLGKVTDSQAIERIRALR